MTVAFKVGDRVRRINSSWIGIDVGDEAVVSGLMDDTDITLEGHGTEGYSVENFELVEAAFTPTFKAGDRVVGVQPGSGVKEGAYYTVTEDSYLSFGEEVVDLEGLLGYVFAYRVQHIKEETVTETFDTYDERMLPLFAKAAEEAERQGYCPEYDGIAAVIGAPSREEIRRLTAPPVPVKTPKELAQEAFDAIPVGHTFHFLDDRSKRHVKLSETTYIFDRKGTYSEPREIETWLRHGIEAN